MKLFLLGVLQDGTDRDASETPATPAKTLTVPIDGNLTLQLDVVRPDGTAPDLTGYTATWGCRKLSDQFSRLPGFTKVANLADPPNPKNRFLFALVPADTKFLAPGRFVHDVWIVSPEAVRNQVVPLSALVLSPALVLP